MKNKEKKQIAGVEKLKKNDIFRGHIEDDIYLVKEVFPSKKYFTIHAYVIPSMKETFLCYNNNQQLNILSRKDK